MAHFGEPMVEVEVAATDPDGILLGEPRLTTVLVDSGADYTILDARLAPVLGIDLARCVPADTSVVGGGTVSGRATHLKIGRAGAGMRHAVSRLPGRRDRTRRGGRAPDRSRERYPRMTMASNPRPIGATKPPASPKPPPPPPVPGLLRPETRGGKK